MKVDKEALAAQAAVSANYQRRVDTANDRREATKSSDLAARDQLRGEVVADRRHREKIAAVERGGLDIDI